MVASVSETTSLALAATDRHNEADNRDRELSQSIRLNKEYARVIDSFHFVFLNVAADYCMRV
ncbi:MAG: hypothetical protein IJX10_05690 [Phascolarctobacterium sp.]|nr:hypothetical protein [Phascolarctobacterium sp.]